MKKSAYTAIRRAVDQYLLLAARRKAVLSRDKKQVKHYQEQTAESLTPEQRDVLNAYLFGKPTGGKLEALLRKEKIEDEDETLGIS